MIVLLDGTHDFVYEVKKIHELIPAIVSEWVTLHGPMKELVVDGVSAIVNDKEAHRYFAPKEKKYIEEHQNSMYDSLNAECTSERPIA